MTEVHREHLSAGMDGALSSEELRFLLRRLDHDTTLRDAWSRYHVAGDSLRRQLSPLASEGFAARVMAAIDAPAATASARRPPWLRWSAGTAIAASVAVAALMLSRPAGTDSPGGAPAVAADGRIAPADTAVAAASRPTPTAVAPVAAVPPWLSASNASQYSQQAAATLGDSYGDITLPYARQLSPYHVQRTQASSDDGELLLIDPQSHTVRSVPRRVAHGAR